MATNTIYQKVETIRKLPVVFEDEIELPRIRRAAPTRAHGLAASARGRGSEVHGGAEGHSRPGYVYLAKQEGVQRECIYIKVGLTGNPKKRRSDLQTGNPKPLHFVFKYVSDMLLAERKLKAEMNRMKDRRVESRTREWFCIKEITLPEAEAAFTEVARKYYLPLSKK